MARHRRGWGAVGGRIRWAALALALLLGGCGGGVLDPRGPVGADARVILLDSVAIMLAIIVPTGIATIAFAWWFRDGNPRARFRPDFVYSGRIELVVWSIPTLVILFLGGIIWIGSHALDPAVSPTPDRRPLELQVVSLDWKWLFIYPDQGIATVNELVVPVGAPLHLSLTSASVMSAFFVPQLGSMIYAMNGMTTDLHLQADHPGDYYGRASHYTGAGFPDMQFTVRAVAPDAFARWAAATRGAGPALDRARYGALARQSIDEPPARFGAVDPGLFPAIVSQAIPPAPGPAQGRDRPAIRPGAGE